MIFYQRLFVWLACLLMCGAGLNPQALVASSHREAPLIADDPLADNTDLYAFRSPDDPNTITLIANYVPLQLPHGGPNYYQFGENVRYEIHIDNDVSTTGDDIIYRVTFQKTNQDPSTFFNIRLGQENLKTTYMVERSTDGGTSFQTIVSQGTVPPYNIGPRSINSGVGLGSDYATLFANAITTASTGEQIFCGPVDDPFFVDLGGVFDLGDLPRQNSTPSDGVGCFNVSTIAIKVPIATLQKDNKTAAQAANILDPDFVIGVWASASRQQLKTLSASGTEAFSGQWVQVSRLGMPLTNEVVIPIGDKDEWNSRTPYNENPAHFEHFYNPELGLYMDDSQFGPAVPALAPLRIQRNSLQAFDFGNGNDGLFSLKGSPAVAGTALDDAIFGTLLLPGAGKPRSVDLWPAFHTGVPNFPPYQLATGKGGNPLAAGKPFVNNFLPNGGDMLRLNMAVPPTPRNDPNFSQLGLIQAAVLGLTDPTYAGSANLQFIPNMDGFPNGRRLEDDVTRIELQAVSGVVLAAIGLWYDDFTAGGTNPVTQDLLNVLTYSTGVDANDTTFRSSFPYVQMPWSGTGKCGCRAGTIPYTQPQVLAPTPFVDEVCEVGNFAAPPAFAFAVYLDGVTGAPGKEYEFDANGGSLVRFDNGTATITGRVVLKNAPGYQWDVKANLVNKRDWAAWSALGRSYKGNLPAAVNNHMNWEYYEIDPSSMLTGVPGSLLAGDTIWLTHRPSSFMYGFQIGLGANDKNGNFGASGWFDFSGSHSGIGDFNFRATCGPPSTLFSVRVMMEGAFDPTTNQMRHQLNDLNALPLLQPYHQTPYVYQGFQPAGSIPQPDIVDWVLLQLRDPAAPTHVIAQKAALVRSDGQVVDLLGNPNVSIEDGGLGQYYLTVCHRNHLDIMTANPVTPSGGQVTVDFTSGTNIYTDPARTTPPAKQLTPGGMYGMIKGDADGNGQIDNQDILEVATRYFSRGHLQTDIDLDGVANPQDAQKASSNQSHGTHIPQ